MRHSRQVNCLACELYFNIVVKTGEGFKKQLGMTNGDDMTKNVNTFLEGVGSDQQSRGSADKPIHSTKPQKTNELVDLKEIQDVINILNCFIFVYIMFNF